MYKNYYSGLDELEKDTVTKEDKPNFKHFYYKHMNKSKLLYNYICEQLALTEKCYDIEKVMTQVLEAMIERLVDD